MCHGVIQEHWTTLLFMVVISCQFISQSFTSSNTIIYYNTPCHVYNYNMYILRDAEFPGQLLEKVIPLLLHPHTSSLLFHSI